MELRELVTFILSRDLLSARQWVADALRAGFRWESVQRPNGLNERELAVAAGVAELLAERAGSRAPPWTSTIGACRESVLLDPGLDAMPRTLARAKTAGPEPLRRRNLIATPEFLSVR